MLWNKYSALNRKWKIGIASAMVLILVLIMVLLTAPNETGTSSLYLPNEEAASGDLPGPAAKSEPQTKDEESETAKPESECHHESWSDGICDQCGYMCNHAWENGVCTICGARCQHEQYADGVCKVCGYVCNDHLYVDGVCIRCDMRCPHEWHDGVCALCNMRCIHPSHNKATQACDICGTIVPHQYINGICDCGKPFEFAFNGVPTEIYEDCDHPGTVENITYQAPDITDPERRLNRKVDVYLPYDYSPDSKYNVLFLIHGGGDDEHSFTTNVYEAPGTWFQMCHIYDNMIEHKLCGPFIVIAPGTKTTFGDGGTRDVSMDQLAYEFRNILLPYVADQYGTYAEGSSEQELQKARAHFAIGGISNGSLFAYNAGMQRCFDLFGSYLCFSGCNEASQCADAINSGINADLPIYLYYAGSGTADGQQGNASRGYEIIRDSTDHLVEGENCIYYDVYGEHCWAAWSIDFYNALQLVFGNTD